MAEGVAIFLAVAGTAVSMQQQHKAQQAQKDADKAGQKQAELENQRSIRQSIAAARLQQAELLASGQAATGGVESSGIQGGLGSAQTQQAANLGFANSTIAANRAINDSIHNYNRFTANAATAGAIANLPGAFGWDVKSSAQSLFGAPGSPTKKTGGQLRGFYDNGITPNG